MTWHGNIQVLIKSLVANKSKQSIKRVTGAADTISEICTKLDESCFKKPKSGHHCKPLHESDKEMVAKTLRKLRPFHQRKKNLWQLNQIITRGQHLTVEQDDDSKSYD